MAAKALATKARANERLAAERMASGSGRSGIGRDIPHNDISRTTLLMRQRIFACTISRNADASASPTLSWSNAAPSASHPKATSASISAGPKGGRVKPESSAQAGLVSGLTLTMTRALGVLA
jgi:hypothetical protein